ncbi:MAG: HEAT repeat domain-containing protein [Planctomycetota bacterium]|jgi:hypothetical protein
MPRYVHLRPLFPILILLLLGLGIGAEAQSADGIAWSKDLTTALAKAKETKRILMICVNAKHVEGREEEEPAAKGLREVVYKDPRVVTKSRNFVCVMMTPKSSTADHGVLGSLGVEGEIVSPQHIFVNSGGDRILLRKQYWVHGKGEAAVKALLEMMDKAVENAGKPPPPEGEAEAAPPESDARAEWIAKMLSQLTGDAGERQRALEALVKEDRDGDCTGPLIALLPEHKKDTNLLRALIRALGRDGLEAAAKPIAKFLGHRTQAIRADAVVSLEYIGSRDKKVVSALVKAVGREKDEAIANHMYRALGRCGVKDASVRGLLLKKTGGGKSEFATYGPAIGLAYFEGDAKAMRGVEKLLKQIGVPGSARGGGQNTVKRGIVSWTLASIGDEKSAKFVREELIAKLKNVKAFWVGGLRNFWTAVADKCDGDDSQMAGIEIGVRAIVGFTKRANLGRYGAETRSLMDESRRERDNSKFKPKGDNLLETDGG